MGLGIKYFVIQIVIVIIFTTDNLIINLLFGPQFVTPYNIAMKYMTAGIMLFNVILIPAWPAFTEATVLNDTLWIRKTIRLFIKLWFFFILVLILLVLFSDPFYKLWIGDKVIIPKSLTILMAIFAGQISFNRIFAHYVNSSGKLMLFTRLSIIEGIFNIPLSIFFAKTLGMGPEGVILATIVCLCVGCVAGPIQTYLLINGKATGVWNK